MRSKKADDLMQLYQSSARISQQLTMAADAALSDRLTMQQFQLMDLLQQSDHGLFPAELVQKLQLSGGSVSSLLNQLSAKDLTRAIVNPTDGRSKRIQLSALGIVMHKKCMKQLHPVTDLMLEAFSADDLSDACALMKRIQTTLTNLP